MERILDFLVLIIPTLTLHQSSGSFAVDALQYKHTINLIGLLLATTSYFSIFYLYKHAAYMYPANEIGRALYFSGKKPERYKVYGLIWLSVLCLSITITHNLYTSGKNQVLLENRKQAQVAQTIKDRRLLEQQAKINLRLTELEKALAKPEN